MSTPEIDVFRARQIGLDPRIRLLLSRARAEPGHLVPISLRAPLSPWRGILRVMVESGDPLSLTRKAHEGRVFAWVSLRTLSAWAHLGLPVRLDEEGESSGASSPPNTRRSRIRVARSVQPALRFAAVAHGDQLYRDAPYETHLRRVVSVLVRAGFGHDPEVLQAGALHDVLEDTPHTREDIAGRFGPNVADTVFRVTQEAGVNRAERYRRTYPKIAGSSIAIAVKLADRIDNFSNAVVDSEARFRKMYLKEHPGFVEALKGQGEVDPRIENLWNTLSFLALLAEKAS